jgi:Zn-dependent metalloprotease
MNNYSKSILLALIIIMTAISCKEQDGLTENNQKRNEILQTTRIYHAHTPLISDSAMAIIQRLFQKNGLTINNLQVVQLSTDNLGYNHVRCLQFFRDIEIFNEEVIFHFNNLDVYYNLSNELIARVDVDTMLKVAMNEASNLFYREIAADPLFQDSLTSFRSQGFNAELGIKNLNAGIGNVPKHFVLAWRMTITNGWKYPFGYIRADSLYLIYYFNGIIYGKTKL